MAQETQDSIQGFEYDWLACDQEGFVGFFSTAGGGYAPDEFLQDVHAHDQAISVIRSMAPCTEPVPEPGQLSEPGDPWQQMAARGLYAFDSSFHGGLYQLTAAPTDPVRLSDLPEAAARVAGQLVYRGLRFSALKSISEDLLRARPGQPLP
ncbi:hypothetical protein [Myxococcus qinghaiensis]|uniref:hypothetical protein n=1 Tax=Myxococcus qinghaiensis TaxID=2906758 RepID=UPI0020A74264|nr:hypothetical protein [Myxococcus qinghaiensis]MCP3167054.1 hypothetical protein [Myxococcus qinghaiensis]